MPFEEVRARRLVKMYGATRALAGIDVTARAGEVTVVEGPNGSGKSTLLTILAQLARPTRGEVRYGDLDGNAHRKALRPHIGILGHAAMVYPDLTGRENLVLASRLHRHADPSQKVEALRARFEIGTFFDRPVRTYSRGQLQRVALARALIHEPKLLLLDEPSTGLDVAGVERLRTVIAEEKARGAVLVLITHDEELAARVADVRVRLHRGRIAEETA